MRPQLSKVIFVVDEDHVGLPGELVDFLSDNLNTFTEVAASEWFTHDLTSIFERNFTELGNPAFPGSFVKKTLMK